MNKTIKTRRSKDSGYYVALLIVILGCLGKVIGFYIGAISVAEFGGIFKNFGLVIIYTLCCAQIGFCGTGLLVLFIKFINEVIL